MFSLIVRNSYRQNGVKIRLSSTATPTTSTASPSSATSSAPAVKEPLIQRWKRFWTILYSDYKEVAVDTLQGMKDNPRKATKYIGAIGFVLYAMETNPEGRTFYETLLRAADDTVLVSEANLNPATDKHLSFIRQSYNEGTIRCLSLGLCSLIWLGNFSSDCGVYPSQCSYLQPGIINFHKRIIDVGFLGKWWNIEWYMKNHDINPAEFAGQ